MMSYHGHNNMHADVDKGHRQLAFGLDFEPCNRQANVLPLGHLRLDALLPFQDCAQQWASDREAIGEDRAPPARMWGSSFRKFEGIE